jgi:two-component system, OmpR family, phosphate regulon sensor histidine kinase PhoR
MQPSSPKNIALLLATIISASTVFIIWLLKYVASSSIELELISIILVTFIFSYLVVYKLMKKYIYDRVKVIYKTIKKNKGATSNMNTDLALVSKDVEDIASQRQKEIDELKMMENFRREFLGNVSHELKTPIFNIQGYIHTLIDGALYDKNVNMAYLERTSKSVDRMINIVEDLVTISKIESDRLDLEMENFDIVDLAKDIFDQTEMKANKANLSISLDKEYDPISVLADRDKIIQVFTNLVVNSIKYGKEGGETKVRFYEMGENILIEVADNGIGISQQNLPRLFERFYRVDKSRSRDQGGTGLGLAIVKHILESHNQVINVRSTEDVGTTFSFTLQKS